MRKTLAIAGVVTLVAASGVAISGESYATVKPRTVPASNVCDIYATNGTPCVAANSTTQALYAAYDGPLYTVTRASDSTTLVVYPTAAGGPANTAPQDTFCEGTTCTITDIADQTPNNNDLVPASAGGNGGPSTAAVANELPLTLEGSKVYGVDVTPATTLSKGVGYDDDDTYMLPTGSAAEGVLMVTSGKNLNNGCCFDYGNAETSRDDTGDGHMAAISYGSTSGSVGADLENGIFNAGLADNTDAFVTAMESSNGTSSYTVADGNTQSGTLTTATASLPTGWHPLHQEGGMVLGVGGDMSATASGDWFLGVMTAGAPSSTAQAAVQAELVAEGFTY